LENIVGVNCTLSFNQQMFADSKYTVDAAAFSGNRQNDIGFQKP